MKDLYYILIMVFICVIVTIITSTAYTFIIEQECENKTITPHNNMLDFSERSYYYAELNDDGNFGQVYIGGRNWTPPKNSPS